jgi:arylsulfatase
MLRDGTPMVYPKNKDVLPGPETTYASLGPEWANVANMPFRFWKAKMYEGGICTPAIAYWPEGINVDKNAIIDAPCHIIDIMATCLEITKAEYPKEYGGNQIIPYEGKSIIPALQTGKRKGHKIIGFEHFNEKALISNDGWKIIQPGKKAKWELYNLNIDRTEMKNVAEEYPKKLTEMIAEYESWAKRTMVLPAPE